MNSNDIASRLQNGYAATPAEKAYLLRTNPYAFAGFMIDNNPGSVNLALRQLGYTQLGIMPDKTALSSQMDKIIKGKNYDEFMYVAKSFNLIPDLLSPQFITEFKNAFTK